MRAEAVMGTECALEPAAHRLGDAHGRVGLVDPDRGKQKKPGQGPNASQLSLTGIFFVGNLFARFLTSLG